MTQKALSYELRLAIDRARRSPRYERALTELVQANPHSSFSSHVRHNLGVQRQEWLLAFLAKALPQPVWTGVDWAMRVPAPHDVVA